MKSPSPKYPPLEKVYVNHGCQFSVVEAEIAILQRNQEKIYTLLQKLIDKAESK